MKNYHYSQVKQAYDAAVMNGRDYVTVKFGDSKWINLPLPIVKLILRRLNNECYSTNQ